MPQFAAHLSMMYQEHSFLDRFAAAARDGFTAVDYMFPYEYPADTIAGLLKENGLIQVLFNGPPGDFKAGERGLTCLPGRESEYRDGFARALEYAKTLDCPRIHSMAGIAPAGVDRARLRETYIANLAWAADAAAAAGKDVLIEPINLRSVPGFFLNRQEEAHAIVAEISKSNIKVLMDLFHVQIQEGDLAMKLRKYIAEPKQSKVGHIHIAGVPDRHEPDTGEVNYEYLFGVIDELGYEGWIGCEYMPAAGTSDGLGWLRSWKAAH
jgi:hydroxypyruvate isomerase